MGRLRAAVIGAGFIAGYGHLPGYRAADDEAEVVAICDLVGRRTARLATQFEIPKQYADWREMLAAERPDVVSVCLPNTLHLEPTLAALESGAHVLCEKPLATSLAEAKEMFAGARRAGRHLMCAQHYRFRPPSLELKAEIEAGRLGEVYYGEATALRRLGIPTWGAFHSRSASAGGALLDIGVHMLDQTLWLMGNPEPVRVSATTETRFGHRPEVAAALGDRWDPTVFDVDDFAVALVRFATGGTLLLRASWASHWPGDDRMTSLVLGTVAGANTAPATLHFHAGTEPVDEPFETVEREAFQAEIAHFLAVARGEAEPLVTEAQSLDVQRILDAAYRSAAQRREVEVEPV